VNKLYFGNLTVQITRTLPCGVVACSGWVAVSVVDSRDKGHPCDVQSPLCQRHVTVHQEYIYDPHWRKGCSCDTLSVEGLLLWYTGCGRAVFVIHCLWKGCSCDTLYVEGLFLWYTVCGRAVLVIHCMWKGCFCNTLYVEGLFLWYTVCGRAVFVIHCLRGDCNDPEPLHWLCFCITFTN
jgi:hypothetical protein